MYTRIVRVLSLATFVLRDENNKCVILNQAGMNSNYRGVNLIIIDLQTASSE